MSRPGYVRGFRRIPAASAASGFGVTRSSERFFPMLSIGPQKAEITLISMPGAQTI
jgi:hypothetical protein